MALKLRQYLLLVLACCASASASAQHGHHPPGGPALAASAAVDPQGTLWAVAVEGRHVVLRQSPDFGRSWSAPRRVNAAPEGVGTEGDARPKIAVGPRNDLHVTWTTPLAKPYTGHIRYSRSVDGGATFAPPVTVNSNREEITHRFDALTVTPGGQVFIAWIDKRDAVAAARAKRAAYAGAAVYFAVSKDGGATFGPDGKLADHSCECCRIALLPTGNDRVLAFWRAVLPPNVRDHALGEMRADGTVAGVRRATFDDWRIDVCPHHGPSLAMDGNGRLHGVWYTDGKAAGVFYGRLRDGGVDGQRRIGGDAAAHADIAAHGATVAIAWKEFDGRVTALKALLSQDAGASWRERTLATTGDASDQPRLLMHDGRFYVFWNTAREPFGVWEATP